MASPISAKIQEAFDNFIDSIPDTDLERMIGCNETQPKLGPVEQAVNFHSEDFIMIYTGVSKALAFPTERDKEANA